MYSSAFYKLAPQPLQSGLITLRALARKMMREGRQFERILQEIRLSERLSAAELATWHEVTLGKLLLHAARHVPFYRDLGLEAVVMTHEATEALAAFPFIDKAIVREQGERFLANDARRPLFKGSTSGTTGTPLSLWQDLAAINRENAFIWRQLEWAGLKPGERRAWLRGDLVVPADQNTPPFWRMNHAENMLMLSSYHLSEDNAPAYVSALEKFTPAVIQAYPSSISFLGRWLDAKGRDYAGGMLKGIVTSSETLSPEQKSVIEKRFGCRVFDWYGQFERVAAIGTCEHGRQHIVSDYSFVELLPAEGGLYEIVGTGFNNFAMPLIRYRTGDYVRLEATDSQCECGRHFPLVASVQGRADDVVKLPDGRHVGRLDHIFKGVDGVLEAQIRQDRIDRIDIFVVPTAGYSTTVETRLRTNARDRLGGAVQINVQAVDSIPRTRNGKLRSVVCNV
jgi:phenylacetate-CoA ligase